MKYYVGAFVFFKMKVVLPFLLIIVLIDQNEAIDDMNFFQPMLNECNSTFPVEHALVLANNISNLSEKIKSDRNGKCYIHCIFHKLKFIDDKGNINKSEVFDNVRTVWEKIPEDKKGSIIIPVISPQMKERVSFFIGSCEVEDLVAQETDPCNKFYNFAQCILKGLTETGI